MISPWNFHIAVSEKSAVGRCLYITNGEGDRQRIYVCTGKMDFKPTVTMYIKACQAVVPNLERQ